MRTTAPTVSYPNDSPTATLAGNSFSSLPSRQYHYLQHGTAGTLQTLAAMAACVRGEIPPDFCGYKSDGVKAVAEWIAQSPRSDDEEVRRLFDFTAHQIKYLAHPPNQQLVQDAQRTIEFKSGDCVSKSVLLATLFASLGYQPKFIAQCPDGEDFSHVYVLVECDGQELRLDPVASDKPMGWTQDLPDGGFETSYSIF